MVMATQNNPSTKTPPCRKKATRPRGYIKNYKPQKKTQILLAKAQLVIEEYRNYLPLTVRQIFYRLVGHYGEEKTEKFYKKLIDHLGNARRGGWIDFDSIRDDGVSTQLMDRFADTDDFIATVKHMASTYQRNLMSAQNVHVEVWCEAAGMLSQLSRVANRYSIQCFSSSGFDSLTTKKTLANRICETGKPAIILHLGDYDPSGTSIFDSADEDVRAFVLADRLNAMVDVEFRRITLTKEQVAEYNLPTSPAKATDSRSKQWEGGTCQLEALAPDQIAEILKAEILAVINHDTMRDTLTIERYEREKLTQRMLR